MFICTQSPGNSHGLIKRAYLGSSILIRVVQIFDTGQAQSFVPYRRRRSLVAAARRRYDQCCLSPLLNNGHKYWQRMQTIYHPPSAARPDPSVSILNDVASVAVSTWSVIWSGGFKWSTTIIFCCGGGCLINDTYQINLKPGETSSINYETLDLGFLHTGLTSMERGFGIIHRT